jgi:hypothetical protein
MATELRTETQVRTALAQRFPKPAWVMLPGVANGTGARARRWADAIAMSVWPSRGLELHCFEIKVRRNDLLRELKDPSKAEAVGRYCDRFWIAAGSKKIAKPEELPPAWGLLVPHGNTMQIVKDASPIECTPIDRTFVAAILRRMAETHDDEATRRKIRQEIHAEVTRQAKEQFQASHEYDIEQLKTALKHSRDECSMLRKQITVVSDSKYSPALIAQAIQLLHNFRGWQGVERRLTMISNLAHSHQDNLKQLEEWATSAKAMLAEVMPEDPRG